MVRLFRRKKDEEPIGAEEDAAGVTAVTEGPVPPPEATAPEDEAAPVDQAVERTRRTWFSRIGGMFRRGLSEELWEELEETLVAADTGVATTLKVIDDVKEKVKRDGVKDPDEALGILKEDLIATLEVDTGRGQLWSNGRSKEQGALRHGSGQAGSEEGGPSRASGRAEMPKPALILVGGVNGTGETTSIGKLAHQYKSQGKKLVLAAADTFRAAAIDQLKQWGQNTGVDVVAHKQGADPGAVVFDALSAAESRGADVVIIDTAGGRDTKAHPMGEVVKGE